jgi:hypothetical protein
MAKGHVKGRTKLYPETASTPIKLSELLEMERRTIVVDNERLTDEYKAWLAKRGVK